MIAKTELPSEVAAAPPKYHGERAIQQLTQSLTTRRACPGHYLPCERFAELARPVADMQGDGREEALLKHLQSLPELSESATASLPLIERSQRVLDAIHEFGKGENRYLMSVGETKGKQVEELVRERKPKVSCWPQTQRQG